MVEINNLLGLKVGPFCRFRPGKAGNLPVFDHMVCRRSNEIVPILSIILRNIHFTSSLLFAGTLIRKPGDHGAHPQDRRGVDYAPFHQHIGDHRVLACG